MELLATFSGSIVRNRMIMPMGEAAARDGRTLPAAPAGKSGWADG
ncbi:MAG: hypothetical protein OXJ64_20525 [Boseongicola sp.]|nr:hypothetical protein [Boseongicola sp.]